MARSFSNKDPSQRRLMRTTTRLVLAFGLIAFTVTASSAQTPPTPTPTPESPAPQQPAPQPTPEQPTPTPTPEQPTPSPTPEQPTPTPTPEQPTPTPAPEQPTPAPKAGQPTRAADRPASVRSRFILSANGGYQVGARDFATNTEFSVFDEPATLSTAGEIESAPIFDFGVAYMINDEYAVGAAFSFFTTESDVAVTAQVPHPLITDQLRTATYNAGAIKHSQPALHLQAIWMVPFTANVDFAVSAGPSLVFVSQEVVTAANLLSEAPPFTSPTIDSVTVSEESKTAFGLNFGIDAMYLVSPRYGVGVTARYVWASADIDGLTDNLTVGGFQLLGGLRVRF
jgi:hypothetical protein